MNGQWLCDTSGFLTPGHSGAGWAPWLRQTYQLANFLIWFSFLAISLYLFKLYRCKKSELPAPGLFVLSTVFLLLCGLSHLCQVVSFVWAPYRLFALVDLVAAAVSVAAACWIPSVVHRMVRQPAHEYIRTVNRALEDELLQAKRSKHELIHRNEALKERVRALEHMLKTNAWITEKNAAMEELTRELADGELTS